MKNNVIPLHAHSHKKNSPQENHVHTANCNHGHHYHAVVDENQPPLASSLVNMCESVEHAVHLLLDGQLVGLPTETVYGLAADALNEVAISEVFELKGRPTHHPLIVHIGEGKGWQSWFKTVPSAFQLLAKAFWPGALTLVAPKASWVPASITGGKETVALRMPSHPLALAVLNQLGGGAVAPSANAFGQLSPTSANHVVAGLTPQCLQTGIALSVLDGGACEKGVESTLVLWREDLQQVQLLRPGSITQSQLEAVLTAPVLWEPFYVKESEADQAPASGTLASHYAPKKPCFSGTTQAIASFLASHPTTEAIAVLAFQSAPAITDFKGLWHTMPLNATSYANQLYAVLHQVDADSSVQQILIETVPHSDNNLIEDTWLAVQDRVIRASVAL